MKKWISLAVTLGVMVLIFLFSSQPGAQSGALSEQVLDRVQQSGTADVFIPEWFSGNVQANVRKWAHVYIYAVLGASMMVTAVSWRWGKTLPRSALAAAAACVTFAATDELHQYFVPGRAMLATDVGVDSLGFLPGILLAGLVVWLLRHRPRKCSQPK
ncbi:VanZ family protein [Gemmiger formicilis]|uniref:VanZ family protein n=1 Tax=Gemmiger formicilis TaxID=745368 RepID=UPI001958E1A7|nr:VanZ family protein [Gemmiger formicilis]MBM6716507.1 VanZ family protein [Gemmiger formicilis]